MNRFENQPFEAATVALAERALADPAFHDLCHREPARAFREGSGITLPAGLTLRFVDFAPGEFIVPLPPFLDGSLSDQLSEMELEGVSGGTVIEGILAVGAFSNTACAVSLAVAVVAGLTIWAINK